MFLREKSWRHLLNFGAFWNLHRMLLFDLGSNQVVEEQVGQPLVHMHSLQQWHSCFQPAYQGASINGGSFVRGHHFASLSNTSHLGGRSDSARC